MKAPGGTTRPLHASFLVAVCMPVCAISAPKQLSRFLGLANRLRFGESEVKKKEQETKKVTEEGDRKREIICRVGT